VTRPSLAGLTAALLVTDRRFPAVRPTVEESDVAAVLAEVEAAHVCGADEPGPDGWGRCRSCREPWPCERWLWAQQLGVQFVGRACDRVARHAHELLGRLS
jgi:hypothetical protein